MKGPRVAVHHVALQTSHFDEAVAFYRDVLGLELLEQRPFKRRRLAWLRAGEVLLELFSNREGDALQAWTDFHPGPVHLAFEVDDLDEFLRHAKKLGAGLHPSHPEPFVPPVPGAGRIAYLVGPDGEEVEVRGKEVAGPR